MTSTYSMQQEQNILKGEKASTQIPNVPQVKTIWDNKARGCVDGRPQRLYTTKEDTRLPTVSIEAMMLSWAKDAKGNRYIVGSDIPGAFLHVDMEDNVHMLLEGTVA